MNLTSEELEHLFTEAGLTYRERQVWASLDPSVRAMFIVVLQTAVERIAQQAISKFFSKEDECNCAATKMSGESEHWASCRYA